MARDEQARHAREHHADPAAFKIARTEPAGKYLAVHAGKLAFEPRVRKLRGHHRRDLRGMEQARSLARYDQINRDA